MDDLDEMLEDAPPVSPTKRKTVIAPTVNRVAPKFDDLDELEDILDKSAGQKKTTLMPMAQRRQSEDIDAMWEGSDAPKRNFGF